MVGDHTETHPMMATLSAHDQREELVEQIARIELLGGPRPRLFRPPYGSFDATTFHILRQLHLLMVLWSTDTSDYTLPGVQAIVQSALAGAHPGAIILMHDAGGDRSETIAALPAIIEGLRKRGLRTRDDPAADARRPAAAGPAAADEPGGRLTTRPSTPDPKPRWVIAPARGPETPTISGVNATATQAPPILHLSAVVGSPLRDSDGERLGKVEDLIVRLGGVGYPPITGFLVTVAGRTSYLGVERVSDIGTDGVVLRKAKLDLRRFERRPEEVLLEARLLDRQLINVQGARLVRANEIELALIAGSWRVVGVDTGPRGGLRRLLPKPLGAHIATGEFLDWAGVEPFVGHVPTVRLRVPHPKLAKLHPAQIADLVEAASRREGEEIIQAVGDDDRELEADVFEELDDQHQREFLEDRPDAQVAEILSRMAP